MTRKDLDNCNGYGTQDGILMCFLKTRRLIHYICFYWIILNGLGDK